VAGEDYPIHRHYGSRDRDAHRRRPREQPIEWGAQIDRRAASRLVSTAGSVAGE
jgi:hypothetical protein